MENLIKAFQIFLKYGNPAHPTHCEHDVMMVNIDAEIVSDEDVVQLADYGFFVDDDTNTFKSYRYGSC